MKTAPILGIAVAAIVAIGAAVYLVDIDQTEEAALPEISVEGGNMPEFEAETGDIEVGETEVTVPTLEIEPPEEDTDLAQNQ
ncbi:hypothetical protein N0B44_28705 [Roseibacterium beibuensis]|uniref:Uncharacterized protein n=1 Tax=[Roseibacterium] beibuensis TaxID=1193142 RepID=A0ABP9LQJ9_9RHOB|nr:hypothetical protein [Roseibacterium beibuensis]MCS6626904.1 hypothetical protein [Roseibacterium beibuensis]